MKSNFYGRFFKAVRGLVRMVYPKYKVDVPETAGGPAVYISHHQNLFGPFITLLWFPRSLHAWILHVFLEREACFKQYTSYTFTERFGLHRTLAQICAFPVSFAIAKLLNSGKGIPVYRGSKKILQTFRLSVDALSRGESIVIFPDIDYQDSSSGTKEMYGGFLYLEKYYHQKTGRHIRFVPLYVSRNKRMIVADGQVSFREGEDFGMEREVVRGKIVDSLNALARKCGDL